MKVINSFLLFLFLGVIGNIEAQVDYNKVGEVSNTYFIENVQLYQFEFGFKKSSILIEDGIISQIGDRIKAPYDAQIIKGDSLFAYPSFIDGLTHAGLLTLEGEKKKDEKTKFPGIPGDERAGITPGNSIQYNSKDNSLTEYRKAGFAAAHIVPKGKMLPGKGSVCLLTKDENVNPYLNKDISLFSQLKGASGVYPGTIIGVLAKWKDLYRKTETKQDHATIFKRNNSGKRPNFSEAEDAMLRVVNKNQSVFFPTKKHKDIARVLQLKLDLGFNLVLTDLKQGWLSIEKIKKHNIPVLLSLDLPEDKDKKKDDTELSKEQTSLIAKRALSLKEYLSQAAKFEEAQIPFGFTMISSKPKDLHSILLKMKENGASEDYLLKALTTHNAKILGIDSQMGSIQKGKMANLFLSTKPYFEEKSKIQYSFIDGVKSEYKLSAKKKASTTSNEDSIVYGTWSYEVDAMGETQRGSLVIMDDSGVISVTLIDADDPSDETVAYDIELNESKLIFYFDIEMGPGQMGKIEADLDFDADQFNGQMSLGAFGSFPATGSLISKPE